MVAGPPWRICTRGYDLPGSNPAGYVTNIWTVSPPAPRNSRDSVRPRSSVASSASLKRVSLRAVPREASSAKISADRFAASLRKRIAPPRTASPVDVPSA
jgi:hypothetical protein